MIEHALALCVVYLLYNRFVSSRTLKYILIVLTSKKLTRITRKVAPSTRYSLRYGERTTSHSANLIRQNSCIRRKTDVGGKDAPIVASKVHFYHCARIAKWPLSVAWRVSVSISTGALWAATSRFVCLLIKGYPEHLFIPKCGRRKMCNMPRA